MAARTLRPTRTSPGERRKEPLGQLAGLQRSVWYLWLPALTVTLLLAAGLFVLLNPEIKWRAYVLRPGVVGILPQLCLGLIALVLLGTMQIMVQARESRELREFILAISEEAAFLRTEYPTDGLTGVLDRRALPDILKRESTWVDRYRIPLCLVLCDIRDFRKINEREGNMAGDLVLKDFAHALQTTVRQTDSVLRYGADEFLCLLPRTDSPGAAAFVRRVGQACQGSARLRDVTIDSGMAVYTAGADVNTTLAQAELNLSAQKKSGHRELAQTGTSP